MDIPRLGFGTWQSTGDDCICAVEKALEVGYRHIDTADRYGNHREIAQALKSSDLKREDYFLTSKKWWDQLTKQDVIDDVHRFLEELQVDYLDLVLVHWPNRQFDPKDTFEGFEELKREGVIKHAGVSNYTVHHIQDVLNAGFEVFTNQVELHPTFTQNDLKAFCDMKNIILTAYSPLGRGTDLELPEVTSIAAKHGAQPAQIILAWIMARGIVAIPKSITPERIKANFESLNIKLDGEDMAKMNLIKQEPRLLLTDWNDFEY